jgi:hypothetical protein
MRVVVEIGFTGAAWAGIPALRTSCEQIMASGNHPRLRDITIRFKVPYLIEKAGFANDGSIRERRRDRHQPGALGSVLEGALNGVAASKILDGRR